MTWSVEYQAESKGAATRILDLYDGAVPQCIKAVLCNAIDNLHDDSRVVILSTPVTHKIVSVKTYGHLATPDSHEVTTVSIEVKWSHFAPNGLFDEEQSA